MKKKTQPTPTTVVQNCTFTAPQSIAVECDPELLRTLTSAVVENAKAIQAIARATTVGDVSLLRV